MFPTITELLSQQHSAGNMRHRHISNGEQWLQVDLLDKPYVSASFLTATVTKLPCYVTIPKHLSCRNHLWLYFCCSFLCSTVHFIFVLQTKPDVMCVQCHRVFFHHCVPAECNSPCQSISLKKNPAGREFHFFGLSPTWAAPGVPTEHSVNR